jgi:hypothetical protein
MGNTLTLQCPSCGLRTEQRVTKTSPTHWHMPSQMRNSFGAGEYRIRERQCESCQHKFETVEMNGDAFHATIRTLNSLQRALGDIVQSNEVNAQLARCVPILIMADEVFGAETDPSVLRQLTVKQLREIVEGGQESLAGLNPDERNCLIDFFGLSAIDGFERGETASPNPDTTLKVLLRKMKHPSRSRPLRKIYSFIEALQAKAS